MIVAGCDVGSRFGKVVIMSNGDVLAHSIVRATIASEETSQRAMDEALEGLDIEMKDIGYIVCTGYGRLRVPFAQETVSELACIAMGAHSINSRARTVIDVGGQDAKVVKVDENGGVKDFILNDKCASGTGRFLEDIARVLEVTMEDMGPMGLSSQNPAPISSQCSVFAKSEVVSLIAERVSGVDIAAGISEAISSRVASMVHRVNAEEEVMLSGGVAKNGRVVKDLQEKINTALSPYSTDPQLVGALGAALLAVRKVE
jgi:predicted CoA-substrate-specific enzyme activase